MNFNELACQQPVSQGDESASVEQVMKSLDFATVMASSIHDMKNSIGMVLSALEDLFDESGQCIADRKIVAQLQYEAKRINGALVQLLMLYRCGTSGYKPNVVAVDVNDFLEESVLSNKPMLDVKGIQVDLHCPPDLAWYFDPFLLGGVLDNVVNNAARYTADRLAIEASCENGFVCLRVQDNGPGFPEAMLGRGLTVCEPLPRSQILASTRLGLYFSSLIASLHTNKEREGYIELSNGGDLGGGCFAIYLP